MIHGVCDLIANNTRGFSSTRAKNSLPENRGFPGTRFVIDPFGAAHKDGMDRDHYRVRIQEFRSQERESRARGAVEVFRIRPILVNLSETALISSLLTSEF